MVKVKGVRLVRGGLSKRVWAVTRWKDTPERGPDAWEALEKFDVTDNFRALVAEDDDSDVIGSEPCPMGCGNATDDEVGGPCSECWGRL